MPDESTSPGRSRAKAAAKKAPAKASAKKAAAAPAPTTPPAAPASATATATAEPPASSYGSYYYFSYESGPYERNEHWLGLARHFAHHIVTDLAPASSLDAGCAIGLLVEALREQGVDAYGIDVSEYAIASVDERVKDHCRQGSLTEPLGRRYDVITCIEVMEHLPPEAAEVAIANLCASTDQIIFSSVPDGYAEPSHINLRPPEEWSVSFARHGFVRDVTYDARWLSPWAVLYRRTEPTVHGLVRDYDRAFTRMYREIGELRATAVELENKLDEVFADKMPGLRRDQAELREVQAQLDQLRELHDDLQERHRALASERDELAGQAAGFKTETYRLRDLLIGREQEAGHLRGRVFEAEAQLMEYGELPQRYHDVVHSTTWRLAWKLMAPYRKVRERLG